MISYSMIVRTKDGLALSSSTDTDYEKDVQNNKKYLKLLARKIDKYPTRCSLLINPHIIHCTTVSDISYMALCDITYPTVLAYSYLSELSKEFAFLYSSKDVSMTFRPYAFTSFDTTLRKLRQKYNSPRSLTTKVNLGDLSLDMKNNPPFQISLNDIEPSANGVRNTYSFISTSQNPQLPGLSWTGYGVIIVQCLLGLINFIRGMAAFSVSNFEEIDSSSPKHSFLFFMETVFQALQCHILLVPPRRRILSTSLLFLGICVCNLYVWEIREFWQILLHTFVAASILFLTVLRRSEPKSPDHNV